jgi:deazaflavin-dependent oxidoreductase (nitroreductase family)
MSTPTTPEPAQPSNSSPPPAARGAPALMKLGMRAAVALYRWTGGAVGGRVGPESVLLLTTTGRKSGQRHTVPVSYFEEGLTLFVIASNAGRESNPAWYLNLVANPSAEIEVKRSRRRVTARVANPQEREHLLAYVATQNPRRNERTPTTRQVPVVILEPA